MGYNIGLTVIVFALSCFSSLAFAETRVTVSTGIEYSSGDYGGDMTTNVIALPTSVRLTADDWTFRVSSAYLSVEGDANVADADDGAGSGTGPDRSARGIGDTTIALEKNFPHVFGQTGYIELEARVRLPTGDEDQGLGVGATDYGVEVEVGRASSHGGIYAAVGYRIVGQNDSGSDRKDGYSTRIGAWLPVSRRVRAGLSATWREASVEGNDDPASATVFVSMPVSRRVRLTIDAGGGLSDASAEYSAGFRLAWRL